MFSRALTFHLGMVLLLIPLSHCDAQEPPESPAESASAPSSLFRLTGMAQSAGDLRKAGEAFERFAKSLDRLTASLGKSLATMSSEFDPFGFKTGFRTIGRQSEMLREQSDIIQSLQQREIDRLQRENQELRRDVQKLRERKRKRNRN